ncbi:M4 family metallopeptidase [Streptomyces sp. NPDC088387]|uniref:M4 family metallopeptidase n=1 Tax=Streptomyces sp. NPDC088387 TaxID=3365859 RepID=UPI0037F23B36
MRRSRNGSARPRRLRGTAPGGISGAAALLGVAALVVSLAPATATATAAEPDPGEVIPGARTDTPALVDGIREQAPAAATAAGAARAHLAAERDRYRIPAPARDLRPAGTERDGDREVVRLDQTYRGIPVLGGQYVVRMEHGDDGERVVTGTSGRYFTELSTGTTAEIDDTLAVERAVDAVLDELQTANFMSAEEDEPALTGTSHGLVVLPTGTGVLARHITVRGTDPAHGEPVLREVYIDARAGYPVLQYSGIRTFGTPAGATTGNARADTDTEIDAETGSGTNAAAETGSGTRLDGTAVDLQVTYNPVREEYLLRDTTRLQDGLALAVWDARGRWASDLGGIWPEDLQEFGSPTAAFDAAATASGAVDAHWASAQVHDYFKDRHGRDSLDGHGMAVNSLVGATDYGQPYVNAFWDGQKMVYGTGDAEYRPLSAALDVVGHEMTHGVIEHSANLVYAGQSGAMNEAIADYFGNAIEADVYGTPVSDPDAPLLGETLCRTLSPRECAIRDMGDGRTTAKSFLGVGFGTDNGGVHLNSTIFSGALWDTREELGAELTDRIVYRALTQYLTPLDGFTQGRDAVLAAATSLGVTGRDLRAVERAFNAHGIVANWELALGVDSDPVLERVNTAGSRVGAGGAWWTASSSNEAGSEPYSVWAGRLDGTGQLKLMSPNDGRYHVNPATDGRTVVWQAHGATGVEILSRPLAGGPVKSLWQGRSVGSALDVDGDVVAFAYSTYGGRQAVGYLSLKDPAGRVTIGGGTYHRSTFPSVSNGKVVYQDRQRVRAGYELTTRIVDVATGEDKAVQQTSTETSLGPTAVTREHVYWLLDEIDQNGTTALRRTALDGSGATDLSPETGPGAMNVAELTVSEEAVTVGARTQVPELTNESLAKLWQFAPDGSRSRVSCNRGEQLSAAAAPGTRVLWIDATTGISDVVTRSRPTGTCA